MGVMPAGPVLPGGEQDLLLRAATEELQDQGFIVAKLDALFSQNK